MEHSMLKTLCRNASHFRSYQMEMTTLDKVLWTGRNGSEQITIFEGFWSPISCLGVEKLGAGAIPESLLSLRLLYNASKEDNQQESILAFSVGSVAESISAQPPSTFDLLVKVRVYTIVKHDSRIWNFLYICVIAGIFDEVQDIRRGSDP